MVTKKQRGNGLDETQTHRRIDGKICRKKNHVILTVSPEYGKSYQHSLSGLLMHVASREQQGKQLMQILLKLQYGKG